MERTLDSLGDPSAVRRLTRRAWLALSVGMLIFIAIVVSIVLLANYYFRHATSPQPAELTIISGSGALIRSPGDSDFRLITGQTTVSEGDVVSTTLGTVLWITLFDGSTVEVAEDTVMEFTRMRSSRFLNSTKHVVLSPERGTVYVAMAPRGEHRYSELTVETSVARVTMIDGQHSENAGSFLVEAQPVPGHTPEDEAGQWARAAVLRGAATVETEEGTRTLRGNDQVRVGEDGSIGPLTSAVRQLIVDGSFDFGLSNWIEFHDAGAGPTSPATAGSVELVNDWINGDRVVAVEFLRPPDDRNPARTGIRQRIGQTLRVYSSVQLEFDLKISAQEPSGGGPNLNEFPFVIELNYVDVLGEERQWSRAFYAFEDPQRNVPLDIGSRIEHNQWEHVIFDMRNLSPLPRQLTSVVVYASGRSYQTLVTNLSLTSSELGHSDLGVQTGVRR